MQLDGSYYRKGEHVNASAGAGDAGKPAVLDSSGQWDPTMIPDTGGGAHPSDTILALDDDVQFQLGTGADYWMQYNSVGLAFELWSSDIDGGGTDGLILSIADGARRVDITGNLSVRASGGHAYSEQFGQGASAGGDYASAFGRSADAAGNNSLAAGYAAYGNTNSTGVGYFANAFGSNSVALGRNAQATGASGSALGDNSLASALGVTAVGQDARGSHSESLVLGHGVDSEEANQVIWDSAGTKRHLKVYGHLSTRSQIYSILPTTLVPTGTTQTVDWDAGQAQRLDLDSATGDVTLTLNNPVAGAWYTLKVEQDPTTPRDLIWPGNIVWEGGSTPVISTGADEVDVIRLWYDGTNYYGHAYQEAASGGGEANTASNLGAGEGLFTSKSGVDLPFKSLVGGTAVTLSSDSNTVTINSSDTTDHTALSNIGTNTHAQIDSHIADSSLHFTEGSIDHGSIDGLGDDDHTQYHNDARGDARYYQQSAFISSSAGAGDAGKPIVLDGSGLLDGSMIPQLDHGGLAGLGDDDHTQYHTDARGDARYYQQSEFINTSAGVGDAGKPIVLDGSGKIDSSMLDSPPTDHGSLTGLGDDDHTQYILANGTRAFSGDVDLGDNNHIFSSNQALRLGGAFSTSHSLGSGDVGVDGDFEVDGITYLDDELILAAVATLASYTTTGRNGLTAAEGMVLYNSDLEAFEGYANGDWIELGTKHLNSTALIPSGTSQAVDWSDGAAQTIDLGSATGDVAVTFSNSKPGMSYLLKVIQGATSRQLTFPAGTKFPGGTVPSITTTDDAEEILSIWYDGTDHYVQGGGQDWQT